MEENAKPLEETTKEMIVDFVSTGKAQNEWRIVLIERGPWTGNLDDHLRRVQGRLYDCLDLVLDGHFAEKYPASNGGDLIIQIDFYNVEEFSVSEFLSCFSHGIFSSIDYGPAIHESKFAKSMKFEFNFSQIH